MQFCYTLVAALLNQPASCQFVSMCLKNELNMLFLLSCFRHQSPFGLQCLVSLWHLPGHLLLHPRSLHHQRVSHQQKMCETRIVQSSKCKGDYSRWKYKFKHGNMWALITHCQHTDGFCQDITLSYIPA